MARSLLIRANDPINALNPEDIPPAIAVVPTEDAGRVNVLEAQLDVIEYINSELEEEIHQFMFDGVGKDEN
jgi:hypothetical protein